jgi:alkaline phosphatase D
MSALLPYERALATMSRRELMRIAWAFGAAAVAAPIAGRQVLAKPVFDRYPFPLGVASGDPLPDGVVLWTRLAPRPAEGGGMPMAAVDVQWEVARDRTFRQLAGRGTALARPELGHSVHVEVSGLEPGRDYWYRFRAGDETSHIGRTRTAPAPGAAVQQLRFGVCGCNHYEHGYFTAFRRMAEEQFDFIIHTGDYIYETRADGGRNLTRVRQHLGDALFTLVDYRNRYAQYKSDPDLIAAHLSAPFIVTWDDHEVGNNYAGLFDEDETPPEIFLLRRAAAYQAYYEAMPLRPSALPRNGAMRLYRRLLFGDLVDLSMLDTRQWRSDQACGDGVQARCREAREPGRTILGDEQERWLFENLASARARWTVIGQQVYTFARNLIEEDGKDDRFAMDKWDGYAAARDRLYRRLAETNAPNPLVLSGDVHLHFGADLKADFHDPRSRTVGVEFTASSISSAGDGTEVAVGWDRVRRDNPHITYHSARRGYIACTATPARMRGDFRVLDAVTTPGGAIRTAGSLVVEAGRPGSLPG